MIVAQEKTGYYRFPTEETTPVKKVKKRKRTLRNRHKLVFIGLVLAAFLVGVAITVFCSQISTLGYKITRLEKELALLHKENYNLNEEIQKMSSLGHIEYVAVNKLGMKKPDDNNILVVNLNEINDAGGIPDPPIKEGQVAGYGPEEEEKGPLQRAFDQLVNRLENTRLPGSKPGLEPMEEKNADNTNLSSQENNICVYDRHSVFFHANYTCGLFAACSGGQTEGRGNGCAYAGCTPGGQAGHHL